MPRFETPRFQTGTRVTVATGLYLAVLNSDNFGVEIVLPLSFKICFFAMFMYNMEKH